MSHTYLYCPKRVEYYSTTMDNNTGQYISDGTEKPPTGLQQANLLTSRVECPEGQEFMHAPVIDFDIPIEVYPSTQLGHNHLYINKEVSWGNYMILLQALANCGFVEQGFVGAAVAKGYTAVRPPGVQKPGVKGPVELTKQNALLRKENYALKGEIEELRKEIIEFHKIKASVQAGMSHLEDPFNPAYQ